MRTSNNHGGHTLTKPSSPFDLSSQNNAFEAFIRRQATSTTYIIRIWLHYYCTAARRGLSELRKLKPIAPHKCFLLDTGLSLLKLLTGYISILLLDI
jgi:hypothetical protein